MALQSFTWQEIADGALNAAPSVVSSAVQTAREFACGLYRGYDRWFGNTLPSTPAKELVRGVWEKICPDGLPPRPDGPVPIPTASCACARYEPRARISLFGGNTFTNVYLPVTGPVYGVETEPSSDGTATFWYLAHAVCSNGQIVGRTRTSLLASDRRSTLSLVSLTRVDGGSECLSPAPPGQPPIVPPPSDEQQRFLPVPIPGLPGITVPVILVRPVVNVDLKPSVEIKVGPINVEFNAGGITVNIGNDSNPPWGDPNSPLPELPDGQPRPPSTIPDEDGGGFDTVNDKLDDVLRRLKDIEECTCDEREPEQVVAIADGIGGLVALPAHTVRVRVTLTRFNELRKAEFGNNDSPDVRYAGWASFGRAEIQSARFPIDFEFNEYECPEWATTFNYNCRLGYEALVSAIVAPPVEVD